MDEAGKAFQGVQAVGNLADDVVDGVNQLINRTYYIYTRALGILMSPVVNKERLWKNNRPSMLKSQPCLHPGDALVSGFHHNGRGSIAAHHGVTHRESLFGRPGIRPELTQDQATLNDLLLKALLAGG